MIRQCPKCDKEALVLLCKECEFESAVLLDHKPLIRHTHPACEGCRTMHANSKTKEEAVEFAKKYLADRKHDNTNVPIARILSHPDNVAMTLQVTIERAWDIVIEYVLNDIVPYLYGEALD